MQSIKIRSKLGFMLFMTLIMAGCKDMPAGKSFLVREGKPCADIVIAEKPERSVRLAASELQEFLFKITGAKLAITTIPGTNVSSHVYVGWSPATDGMKITAGGLKYGAFKIKSGDNFLVLLGDDADFVPPQPGIYTSYDEKEKDRVYKEWDAITGSHWGNQFMSEHRRYAPELDIWEQDGKGSLNAVYEFLRGLGCRWYCPGEIGEIVPKMDSVEIPQADKVIRPDFPARDLLFYYHEFWSARKGIPWGADEIKWQLRQGFNPTDEVIGRGKAHGIMVVHCRDEMKQAHPENYALWGGKRQTNDWGAPCLSSPGLFEENVKYARAVFDHYNEPMISVMPSDSYVGLCECELCKGKSTPERGHNGTLSDYVWDYVNRVAIELYKTHPDKKITCLAYGNYSLPPEKIKTFSPNVVIGIAQGRVNFHDPEVRKKTEELRRMWLEKIPSKALYEYEYYLHGRPLGPGDGMPVYFMRSIVSDLRALKGVSLGDYIEVYRTHGAEDGKAADIFSYSHLNSYVTGRFYWDVNQDLDAMLEEYYDKFFGPARKEMKAFMEYAEANWMNITRDKDVIDRSFELLDSARKAAGETVYGKRIERIIEYVQPMKTVRMRLSKSRANMPEVRVLGKEKADIKLDGKLNDKFWKNVAGDSLGEIETGRPPQFGTWFNVVWAGDSLYFGVRCRDRDGKSLNIASRENDDTNIWNGDCINILLETQSHSYYQITVNPAGAMVDADRNGGKINTKWSSGAEVAASIDDDGWSLEVRVPVLGNLAGDVDPLNGVAGQRPTRTYPWLFNICRQRVRTQDTEISAFSPTGKRDIQDNMKFGKLYTIW